MWSALIFATTLAATPATPPRYEPARVPTAAEVLAVPEPLRAAFQAKVVAPGGSQSERLIRLTKFLFDPEGMNLQYAADADFSVAEVYATRQANCLSFSLLALTLAREAGLTAYGQGVATVLYWSQDNSATYHSTHVNVGLKLGKRLFTLDVASRQVLTDAPPTKISDELLLAQYYNNRAADFMATGDFTSAERFLREAQRLDDSYAPIWNNYGVLERRRGQLEAARAHFERALKLSPDNAGALSNLSSLLAKLGDAERSKAIAGRLAGLQRRNPFYQIQMATDFEIRGDFDRALTHYRRAIRLRPDEPRFYARLAQLHLKRGELTRAITELKHAHAYATGSMRRTYRGKVEVLRKFAAGEQRYSRSERGAAPLLMPGVIRY